MKKPRSGALTLPMPLIGLNSAYSQARLSWRLGAYRAEPGY